MHQKKICSLDFVWFFFFFKQYALPEAAIHNQQDWNDEGWEARGVYYTKCSVKNINQKRCGKHFF